MSQPKPLEFDQPPTSKETKSNPTATLTWLKPTISTIYQTARTTQATPTLTRPAYLNLYSAAHDYVEVTKHTSDEPNARDLYSSLSAEIKAHCLDVRTTRLLSSPSRSTATELEIARHILTSYLSQHSQLTSLATLMSHLLQHLERHWIKRMIYERQSLQLIYEDNAHNRAAGIRPAPEEVFFIRDLHTQIWKEEVFAG